MRLILAVAVLGWLFRSFAFAAFSIPSGSMLPTLYIGDYLFVAKWPYGYSRFSFPFQIPSFDGRILASLPSRGDVAVFVPPGQDGVDYVKRVIALPGDTVQLRRGQLILNGNKVRLDDPRTIQVPISANSPCHSLTGTAPRLGGSANARTCLYRSYRETLPDGTSYRIIDQVTDSIADDFGPITVPAGRVFLMGDNRDDSLDSRFPPSDGGIGLVPMENLVGRATVLFWSTDGSASYARPWTWFSALRANRIANGLAPAHNG